MSQIDPQVAEQLAAALPHEEFLVLLETFQADLGRLARECAEAAEAGDLPALRRAAHSLAGAASGIGAHGLEAAARNAMSGTVIEGSVTTVVGRIGSELAPVLAELGRLAALPPRE